MLRARLADALKLAMKDKNAKSTATLRLILAALKDRDIASRTKGKKGYTGKKMKTLTFSESVLEWYFVQLLMQVHRKTKVSRLREKSLCPNCHRGD